MRRRSAGPVFALLLPLALVGGCDRKPGEPGTTTTTTTTGADGGADTDAPEPPPELPAGKAPVPLDAAAIEAAIPTEPPPERFWEQGDAACPAGGKLQGGLPPTAREIRCVDTSGRWTGPEARFHPGEAVAVQSIGRKQEGRMVGVWWYFHADGSKAAEHAYVDGELHGTLRRWSPTGVEIELGEYRGGRPWGLFVDRDEAGQELARTQLDAGTGKLVRASSSRRTESDYVDGLLHGVHREYDADGRLRGESHWAGGEMHGVATRWDESGAKRSEQRYVDGARDGEETRWRDGHVVERSTYVANEQRTRQLYRDDAPLRPLPPASACDEDPGLSSALEAARGRGLSERHNCVTRNPLFPGVVVIGDFAYDAGCRGGTWMVDCALTDPAPDAPTLLARAGWTEADGDQRIVIAQEYLRSFGLGQSMIVHDPDKPEWKVRDDGGIEAILWVQAPSGMRRGRELDKLRLDFAPDGALSRKQLEHRSSDD